MFRFYCLALAVCCAAATQSIAEDRASGTGLDHWPHWRGPLVNGSAPGRRPPLTWSETENIRWKIAVPGTGSASPIIWGNKLFLLTAIPTDREGDAAAEPANAAASSAPGGGRGGALARDRPSHYHQFCVLCYDRDSGEEVWRRVAAEEIPHEGGHPTNTFASGSPVTDGSRLFVTFGSFGIYCYDLDGNLLWRKDLGKMQTRNAFGEGTSPAVHGDTVVITWDHEGPSFIVALDARNGEELWRRQRDEVTTWATPLIVEHEGRAQVVTNGTTRVRSYDLQTGDLLWECGGQAVNPIPSPVAMDDLAICMTGYRGYAVYAVPLSARGDVTDSDTIAWQRTDAGPYISSPLLHEGTLYFTKGRDAILYNCDAVTGKTGIESQRIPGLGTLYASPVAAGERVYFTDRDGTTTVLQHGNDLKTLATNRLDGVIDASAALVDNRIYLRSWTHLYCIEEQ